MGRLLMRLQQSVKLFNGGYEAPPITLGFNSKEVLFRNSAYANFEEYLKEGPMRKKSAASAAAY